MVEKTIELTGTSANSIEDAVNLAEEVEEPERTFPPALVFGLVNAILGPILTIVSLPLIILTLGLFWFVVNALLLVLVGFIVPGFDFYGFFPALIVSIVLAAVNLAWKAATRERRD